MIASDREELLTVLRELGRLDLDQLVRDQDGERTLGLLTAVTDELEAILGRGALERRSAQVELAELEAQLDDAWPGEEAAELLRSLARVRRGLAELDAALAPCHRVFDEASRRCPARSEAGSGAGPGPGLANKTGRSAVQGSDQQGGKPTDRESAG